MEERPNDFHIHKGKLTRKRKISTNIETKQKRMGWRLLFYPKHNDFTIQDLGISIIEKVQINGIEHALLIQSERIGSPVLLFIHGGPSMPIPGVSSRNSDYALALSTKELVKHFTVVFYDQRGTGKTYTKDTPPESMRIKQFVSDAKEITEYLKKRFKQEKIHLVAHSWGTTIGLYLVNQHPELFHSYTALSQIVSWSENDRLGYQWVLEKAKEANNRKAIRELEAVGEPPYVESFKQWSVLRKWLMKFKSMLYDAGDKASPTFFKGIKLMLKSHDYRFIDVYHSLVSGFRLAYSQEMIEDLAQVNFFVDAPKIEIPVYFIHGQKETHVFPELAVSYFEQVVAPRGKEFYWLPKSAHMYHPDDAKLVEELLIKRVLQNRV
jgi:pimeloyl-ACP methyl ester carboxylesterase